METPPNTTAPALTRVCALSDLPDKGMRCFRVEGVDVLIARENGQMYALQNRCGHAGAPLHRGELTDGLVVCPLHGAAFHLDTGAIEWTAILPPPLSEYIHSPDPRLHKFGELLEAIETLPIRTYPITIRDGAVFIALSSPAPGTRTDPA